MPLFSTLQFSIIFYIIKKMKIIYSKIVADRGIHFCAEGYNTRDAILAPVYLKLLPIVNKRRKKCVSIIFEFDARIMQFHLTDMFFSPFNNVFQHGIALSFKHHPFW